MIEIDVEATLGSFPLKAHVDAPSAGVTALFGRSGAGKSSLVGCVMGLVRPSRGRIVVGDRTLFSSEDGIDIPVSERGLGTVFQDGRLFPHMNVRNNLLYGARARGAAAKRQAAAAFDETIHLLGLEGLLERRPQTLSGGERQRVAIGRALLSAPDLLIMDEPLAALDAARRRSILPYLSRLRESLSIPILYVSHQMDEIIRLADTLVLMDHGSVAATGAVEDLTARLDLEPLLGRYEAGAVLSARVAGHDPAYALSRLSFPGGELLVPAVDMPVGATLRVRVRARDVTVALTAPKDASWTNVLKTTIEDARIDERPDVELALRLPDGARIRARVTRLTWDRLSLSPGMAVFALVKTVAIDRTALGRIEAGWPARAPETE